MKLWLCLVCVVALVATACSDTTSPTRAAASGQIDWEECGQIECGTFVVPLDYDDPDGDTIELSLIRIKARDESRRLGVLMANPGGPGASANEFVRIWRLLLSSDVRASFDIVSFDPRGVGDSSPIVCHDTLQELVAADPDPDTEAEWQHAQDVSREFAEDCAAKYAGILPHVGTRNVARDMDAIRQALGESQINYVGYSYGTSIGAVYADMFPTHIRSMVLDGGTDLSLGFEEVNKTQMVGFERAFEAYLQNCRDTRCAIADAGDPRAVVDQVIATAEKKPIPAKGADRDAGPGEVQLGIISALYSKQSWSQLTRALDDARDGDGTGLVRLVDSYLQRDSDGDYPNLIEANAAVNYVDAECPKDPEAYRALADDFAKASPTFGRSAATAGLTCAYWQAPADPVEAPKGEGAPPIIVIATTNDPATPYEWGKALSEQLESGILVTHRGEGHTIYAQGNSCIDAVVNSYLLTLAVPSAGTTCGNGPPPPGETTTQASPTASPRSEADPTRTPRPATAAPAPPNAGDGRDSGSFEVGLWAIGLAVAGIVVAGLAVFALRNR